MAKKSEKLIESILNKLFALVVMFYGAMLGATKLDMAENFIRAMETSGTLTLGAWISLIKDKFDGEDENRGLDEDPIASNGNLTANEVFEDQDWS